MMRRDFLKKATVGFVAATTLIAGSVVSAPATMAEVTARSAPSPNGSKGKFWKKERNIFTHYCNPSGTKQTEVSTYPASVSFVNKRVHKLIYAGIYKGEARVKVPGKSWKTSKLRWKAGGKWGVTEVKATKSGKYLMRLRIRGPFGESGVKATWGKWSKPVSLRVTKKQLKQVRTTRETAGKC